MQADDLARTAGVHADLSEPGGSFLGRELVGDGPPGGVAGGPQLLLQGDLVDLHHHAVDLVVDRVAVALPALAESEHLLQRLDATDVGIDRQAGLFQVVQDLGVTLGPSAFHRADAMAPQAQGPRGGDAGVLLAKASGGCVARIGEGLLAPVPKFLVELLEGPDGQVDLAPDLEDLRMPGPAQTHRDGADGSDVRGDVIPDGPVAPGRSAPVGPILVRERHRQAIDLQLADELGLLPDHPLDPLAPRVELLPGERVVQREHRNPVPRGGEQLRRRAADALRRAVGGDELGERLFQRPELPHELVVLGVGDLRVVQDVVPIVVVVDEVPELLDASLGVGATPLLGLVSFLRGRLDSPPSAHLRPRSPVPLSPRSDGPG